MGFLKSTDILANAARQMSWPHKALPQDAEARTEASVINVVQPLGEFDMAESTR